MTETDERSPNAFDLWLMRHSSLVLIVGLALGVVGVVVGGAARAQAEETGIVKWIFYGLAFLLVGLAARARSMAKRSLS